MCVIEEGWFIDDVVLIDGVNIWLSLGYFDDVVFNCGIICRLISVFVEYRLVGVKVV